LASGSSVDDPPHAAALTVGPELRTPLLGMRSGHAEGSAGAARSRGNRAPSAGTSLAPRPCMRFALLGVLVQLPLALSLCGCSSSSTAHDADHAVSAPSPADDEALADEEAALQTDKRKKHVKCTDPYVIQGTFTLTELDPYESESPFLHVFDGTLNQTVSWRATFHQAQMKTVRSDDGEGDITLETQIVTSAPVDLAFTGVGADNLGGFVTDAAACAGASGQCGLVNVATGTVLEVFGSHALGQGIFNASSTDSVQTRPNGFPKLPNGQLSVQGGEAGDGFYVEDPAWNGGMDGFGHGVGLIANGHFTLPPCR
jgi:hypothetical protein